MNRKTVFVAAALLLLVAFGLAAWLYQGGSGQPTLSPDQMQRLERAHAPTFGPADAKVHIVEFLDPACETCRAFYPFVKQLMAAHPGRIRLSVRHVAFHEGADFAVQVLEASKRQDKYWPTLERVLASQPRWAVSHRVLPDLLWPQLDGLGLDLERLQWDMKDVATARHIAQDDDDARALGVQKTPEYFVNGRQMATFGQEELRQLIEDELARRYP